MSSPASVRVAVIGGGPAGLMAAETLADAGLSVDLFDAMPSVGRKFLLAGKGGMNLTHAEPRPGFDARYGAQVAALAPMLDAFGPDDLRAWAQGLGIETFVGSSDRVFPRDMKAAPLLRAWLARLRGQGVRFHMRHRWLGWTAQSLRFATAEGEKLVQADAVVLALGGGSWARLGSDGAWVPWLRERGVDVAQLAPSNCGFDIAWTPHFRERHAGAPLQSVVVELADGSARQLGEATISEHGIEGSVIYALSAKLRDAIAQDGHVTIHLDLAPGRSLERLVEDLSWPRGTRSMANHLRSRAGIDGVKAGLLREVATAAQLLDPVFTAGLIKRLPLRLLAARPIDEAISSAGGVRFDAMTNGAALTACPGVFCAGEMLDWEAPTGGYLLTACMASGRWAGSAARDWLSRG
ncbi:TIGR03862 family flavoprotein [Pigmentiphaga aceris]|uniref:TIGR03862 family flavoprotein n=1 Tax=Pigmentiphaga aceris TaxID=1940612 RepID=A0A5C0B603_9BURK|nr:TIGR03862 family flavoprotein [Pigmentiphaga aceris]QEI08007.1 TIGR03862 family flavoprotein [Pigmentiphaga aceris]